MGGLERSAEYSSIWHLLLTIGCSLLIINGGTNTCQRSLVSERAMLVCKRMVRFLEPGFLECKANENLCGFDESSLFLVEDAGG